MNYEYNLKNIREENALTQQEMADLLNMSKSNYNELENGKKNLAVNYILQICDKFNVSSDTVINANKDKTTIVLSNEELETLAILLSKIMRQINYNTENKNINNNVKISGKNNKVKNINFGNNNIN